tara:strand:- start:464 stop:1516 length:1053 start_codon:yes stop_codon:yes gene_type:complete
MNELIINDKRKQSDFKNISFSEFSKSHVRKELIKSIHGGNVEPACYWSAELICAGHFLEIWNIIINYVSKFIHIGNPKLQIYLCKRLNNFCEIIRNGYIDNEINLRNNNKIRCLFAEIIGIVTLSKKKHTFENYTIKNTDDFNITNITSKLKAISTTYAEDIIRKNDPREIFIAINEFLYSISLDSKDLISACYWIEWIIKFDYIKKQRKEECLSDRREFIPVDHKYQLSIIWILWEALILTAKKRSNIYEKIINSLLELYCLKFKPTQLGRKKYILYAASSFLTEEIDFNIPLINNINIIKTIKENIDIIYKQIKKNEITPSTDYLFNNLEKTNTEKTIEKLEKINNIF